MSIEEALFALNQYGAISSPFLVRKYNVTFDEARKILKEIVDSSTNVIARNDDQICIDTRMPEAWKPKLKKPKAPKQRKRPIWKDVTRP